jgi:methionyl-tRNA formyltransferase
MRIVVLTRGGPYVRLLLRELGQRGLRAAAVVVHTRASLAECFPSDSRWPRAALLPAALLRAAVRRVRARRRYRFEAAGATIRVPALNSEATRRAIARLAPDLLVLAGVGLLEPPLLSLARVATLNGHPGLLPWVRGNDVVVHALLRDVAIGATCHLIDAGIDTGPIIERRLLRIPDEASSLREIEAATGRLTAELLADVVAEYAAGRAPGSRGASERWPLCRRATQEERVQAEEVARRGRAHELFEAWRSRCDDAEQLRLPPTEELG